GDLLQNLFSEALLLRSEVLDNDKCCSGLIFNIFKKYFQCVYATGRSSDSGNIKRGWVHKEEIINRLNQKSFQVDKLTDEIEDAFLFKSTPSLTKTKPNTEKRTNPFVTFVG